MVQVGDQAVRASRYLDVPSAAVYLSLSPTALYHRVARRTIPFIKQGKRVLFDRDALDRWMRRKAVDPTRQAGYEWPRLGSLRRR